MSLFFLPFHFAYTYSFSHCPSLVPCVHFHLCCSVALLLDFLVVQLIARKETMQSGKCTRIIDYLVVCGIGTSLRPVQPLQEGLHTHFFTFRFLLHPLIHHPSRPFSTLLDPSPLILHSFSTHSPLILHSFSTLLHSFSTHSPLTKLFFQTMLLVRTDTEICHVEFTPKILDRYPEYDYKDSPLPETIPMVRTPPLPSPLPLPLHKHTHSRSLSLYV
jgi:hypothetical protein